MTSLPASAGGADPALDEHLALLYGTIAALTERGAPLTEQTVLCTACIFAAVAARPDGQLQDQGDAAPFALTGPAPSWPRLRALLAAELKAGRILAWARIPYQLDDPAQALAASWPGRARLQDMCSVVPLQSPGRLTIWFGVAAGISDYLPAAGGEIPVKIWQAALEGFDPQECAIAALLVGRLGQGSCRLPAPAATISKQLAPARADKE